MNRLAFCGGLLVLMSVLATPATASATRVEPTWGHWAASSEASVPKQYTVERIQSLIETIAIAEGTVPVDLALALARVESNFDNTAISHKGAVGVMQIMPATAASEFGVSRESLFNPVVNITLGLEYLHRLYLAYGERWDAALSHYNGGSLGHRWAPPHSYTEKYIANVSRWQARYQATTHESARSAREAQPVVSVQPKPVYASVHDDRRWLVRTEQAMSECADSASRCFAASLEELRTQVRRSLRASR